MGPPSGGRRRDDLRGPSRKLCQDYGRLLRPAPNAQSGLAIARPSQGGPQIILYQMYENGADFAFRLRNSGIPDSLHYSISDLVGMSRLCFSLKEFQEFRGG